MLEAITTGAAFIFLGIGAILAENIRRSVGNLEGLTKGWAERLKEHSKEIESHAIALVRLEGIPRELEKMSDRSAKAHADLAHKIDNLSKQWQDNCRDCLREQMEIRERGKGD